MKVERGTLEDAHAALTAAVRKETVKALRTNRMPEPPAHLMFRSYMVRTPDRMTINRLGKIAKGLADQVVAEGYNLIGGTPEHGAQGVTNAATKTVTIATNLQPEYEVAVMIHELAHIRLRHYRRGTAGLINRELAEVEAESVAYLVATALGLDPMACSAAYLAAWCEGDMEYLRMSAKRCITTAEAILEDLR